MAKQKHIVKLRKVVKCGYQGQEYVDAERRCTCGVEVSDWEAEYRHKVDVLWKERK
jgi:hypothetical protein